MQLLKMPHTHIILANVDTLAIHSERHVDTVIDQQRHLVSLCQFVKPAGHMDQITRIACLLAQLDAGDAASEGLLDDSEEVSLP